MENNRNTAQLNLEKWATFILSKEKYSINALIIKEVLKHSSAAITSVPHSPHFVLGLINLRGNVVTVIDGRRRLGLQEGEITENSCIVILETKECVVGVLVDEVSEVIDIDRETADQTPNFGEDKTNDFIQSVYHHGDELLILLNSEAFLDGQDS